MKYSRIWTGEHSEAQFSQMTLDRQIVEHYARGVPSVSTAAAMQAGSTHLVRLAPGWEGDWHPVPHRQISILLQGRMEIGTEDVIEIAEPGDVGLLEDTTGRGHRSRVLSEEDAILAMILLPEHEG